MISLEETKEVFDRQQKNVPYKCIECLQESSGYYIDHFTLEDPCVIWLDYASPNELKNQVLEFVGLLPKLSTGDILKITLNANAATLGNKGQGGELYRKRLNGLSEKLGEYLPSDVKAHELRGSDYAAVLVRAISVAAQMALKEKVEDFIPLAAFAYKDTHRMLTITGIKENYTNKEQVLNDTGLVNWEFLNQGWSPPVDIDMPILSLRERMLLDGLLPSEDAASLQAALGFNLDSDSARSVQLIKNYLRLYRHHQQFSEILI